MIIIEPRDVAQEASCQDGNASKGDTSMIHLLISFCKCHWVDSDNHFVAFGDTLRPVMRMIVSAFPLVKTIQCSISPKVQDTYTRNKF